MSPRWDRIIALFFLTAAGILMLCFRGQIGTFLASIGQVAPGHSAQDQAHGLIALGFVLICLLVFIKVLLKNRNGGGRP